MSKYTYVLKADRPKYRDGPTWDSEREEYWACCDVCDTDTCNAHENVTEDWMIDHANAHIGGTI